MGLPNGLIGVSLSGKRRKHLAAASTHHGFMKGDVQMNWEKIKLGLWSALGGAVVLVIVGFAWGGWVTGGASQKRAEEMTATAIVDRLAPLCIAQFNQDPEKDQKFADLKKTSFWQRKGYVEEQGWATMLGEKEPDHEVAVECVNRLMKTS